MQTQEMCFLYGGGDKEEEGMTFLAVSVLYVIGRPTPH